MGNDTTRDVKVGYKDEPAFLVQLHWENPATHQTEFVAQFKYGDDIMDRIRKMIERRQDECPEGWMPLVCTETDPMFVKAVA